MLPPLLFLPLLLPLPTPGPLCCWTFVFFGFFVSSSVLGIPRGHQAVLSPPASHPRALLLLDVCFFLVFFVNNSVLTSLEARMRSWDSSPSVAFRLAFHHGR